MAVPPGSLAAAQCACPAGTDGDGCSCDRRRSVTSKENGKRAKPIRHGKTSAALTAFSRRSRGSLNFDLGSTSGVDIAGQWRSRRCLPGAITLRSVPCFCSHIGRFEGLEAKLPGPIASASDETQQSEQREQRQQDAP